MEKIVLYLLKVILYVVYTVNRNNFHHQVIELIDMNHFKYATKVILGFEVEKMNFMIPTMFSGKYLLLI